jgi:signal transduction histidine kinase/DNA-binding response OmpR family regulator
VLLSGSSIRSALASSRLRRAAALKLRRWIAPRARWVAQHGGAALALLGIVVLWGGVLYALTAQREQAFRGAVENTANLARAFEEHIIRSIKTVDQTLLYVRDSYAKDPEHFDIAAWTKATQFLPDLTFQITLIDKAGMMIGSNLASSGASLDLSDREHFRVHVDNPRDELFISKPVLGRASGKWSIQLTRKIIAADGSFGGVVVVSLDPLYLSKFYESVDLGSEGVVTLVGVDGIVRARATPGDRAIGQSLVGSRLFAEYARAKSGTYETSSVVDRITRIHAYRTVRGYPLIVTVGIAEDEVMTDYDANRRTFVILASVLTLLLLVVMAVIARHQAGLRRTREKLRASEARYAQKSEMLEATLENMSQGIIMVDAERRVQVCNRRARAKLELPEELMASHPQFDDVLRWQWQHGEFGEDGGDVETWLRSFVLSGGISSKAQTYERTRPNGTVLEIRSTPMQGGGVVRTYTDVTLHKQTEAVLLAARDEADRAARAKSEFLAMMSHEIRSPMNGLLGIVELLRDTPLEAEQRHMVELVHQSAASLLRILNDVLDFSKIEAGAIVFAPEAVDLRGLVQLLVGPPSLAAAKKGLVFDWAIDDDLPDTIEIDPLRLGQILGNLVTNAIKFTAAGAVGLRVRRAALASGGPALAFAVTDTGIGMSAETLAQLFQPFTQANASTTKNFGGTGLGLSISRRLARLLGGDIEAASTPGHGSTFTLTIPLVAAAALVSAAQVEDAADRSASLEGMRVLVAEDQETNRWLVKRQLERLGVVCDVVEGGAQALAALASRPFDLLLTDCHMPEMDGTELTRRVRAGEVGTERRLPILGLTADVTSTMRERCLAAGMDDIAAKPINLQRLETALRRLLVSPDGSASALSSAATAPGEAVFDSATYVELFSDAEVEGREWLTDFLEAAAALVETLEQAAVAPDRDRLTATAHRLAGAALSAGATQLGILAGRLEAEAGEAAEDGITQLVGDLAAALRLVRAEIETFLSCHAEPVS